MVPPGILYSDGPEAGCSDDTDIIDIQHIISVLCKYDLAQCRLHPLRQRCTKYPKLFNFHCFDT